MATGWTRIGTVAGRIAVIALMAMSFLISTGGAEAQQQGGYGLWFADRCYYVWTDFDTSWQQQGCQSHAYGYEAVDGCYYHAVDSQWQRQACHYKDTAGQPWYDVATYADGNGFMYLYETQGWVHYFVDTSGMYIETTVGWLTFEQYLTVVQQNLTPTTYYGSVAPNPNAGTTDTSTGIPVGTVDDQPKSYEELRAEVDELTGYNAAQARIAEIWLAPACNASYNGCD